jgi:hypothetical protein
VGYGIGRTIVPVELRRGMQLHRATEDLPARGPGFARSAGALGGLRVRRGSRMTPRWSHPATSAGIGRGLLQRFLG